MGLLARAANLPRTLSVRREEEVCSGLMWLSSHSVPWTCRADTHVYNVRMGPMGWAPLPRTGLVWLRFPLPLSAPEDFAYVQVRQERADATVLTLEIDGVVYPVVRADASD